MKVLIIGLRNAQALSLKQMYKDLDLRFISSASHHSKTVQNKNSFDYIINLTKFSSHKIHNLYRKHLGYVMLSGGCTSVINLLSNIK